MIHEESIKGNTQLSWFEKDGRHHRLNVYGIRIDLHVGYRSVMIAVRLNAGIEYLQTNLMPVSWLVAEHDFTDFESLYLRDLD